MFRIRRIAALLTSVLMFAFISGCSPSANSGGSSARPDISQMSEKDRWLGKFSETVTVKLAVPTNAATEFPPGDSYSENVWTRAWLEELNIKMESLWEAVDAGGDYETKLNLSIASDDLPDIINFKTFSQFDKLLKAGKLEDLTWHYENFASDALKTNISLAGDAIEWGKTSEGNLMGIPQKGVNYQNTRMIFIREDWLAESGLPDPKTMEDVIAIAKAFKDKDPANRLGLPFFKTVIDDGMCDIRGIANAFGAYPRAWFDDGTGALQYGTIQPEMKTAIQVYADLYAQGYIDPAFASLDGGAVGEQLTSNKIGVIIGNSWLPGWPLNTLYDTDDVNWKVFPLLPSSTLTKPFKAQTDAATGQLLGVRKGYAHPEALLKILNFSIAMTDDPETAQPLKFHSDPAFPDYGYHMYNPIYVYWSDPMINFDTQVHVTDAIDKKDLSYLKTPHDQTQYNNTIKWFEALEAGSKPTGADWAAWISWYGEGSAFAQFNYYFANDLYFTSALTGLETDTMVKQWGNLKTIEEQYITEIVSGTRPVSDFDEFVATWKSLGGDDIIKEVNEWYKSK
ncbi:MAG: extracellular solute-binding protein [Clostridiales bacterium]|jgi:putative aldouronate transport system substrate-binding protein|nr:extracellular solute-binding protein [Clostridiales bacterium]